MAHHWTKELLIWHCTVHMYATSCYYRYTITCTCTKQYTKFHEFIWECFGWGGGGRNCNAPFSLHPIIFNYHIYVVIYHSSSSSSTSSTKMWMSSMRWWIIKWRRHIRWEGRIIENYRFLWFTLKERWTTIINNETIHTVYRVLQTIVKHVHVHTHLWLW